MSVRDERGEREGGGPGGAVPVCILVGPDYVYNYDFCGGPVGFGPVTVPFLNYKSFQRGEKFGLLRN